MNQRTFCDKDCGQEKFQSLSQGEFEERRGFTSAQKGKGRLLLSARRNSSRTESGVRGNAETICQKRELPAAIGGDWGSLKKREGKGNSEELLDKKKKGKMEVKGRSSEGNRSATTAKPKEGKREKKRFKGKAGQIQSLRGRESRLRGTWGNIARTGKWSHVPGPTKRIGKGHLRFSIKFLKKREERMMEQKKRKCLCHWKKEVHRRENKKQL